jgi:hypothetical protein
MGKQEGAISQPNCKKNVLTENVAAAHGAAFFSLLSSEIDESKSYFQV